MPEILTRNEKSYASQDGLWYIEQCFRSSIFYNIREVGNKNFVAEFIPRDEAIRIIQRHNHIAKKQLAEGKNQ